MGSGVERIDPLCSLAGCQRWQPGTVCALLAQVYFECVLCCFLGPLFCDVVLHLFVILVRLSVPVQVIDWKDSLTKMTCNILMGTLLLNRWSACLTGSSILVLKLTFSPDPFPRNLPLSLMDWFHGFYPARLRKSTCWIYKFQKYIMFSMSLKTLVSAAD